MPVLKDRRLDINLSPRRAEQIRCVVDSTVEMYADLKGIAGKTLLGIEGFDSQLLAADEDSPQLDRDH